MPVLMIVGELDEVTPLAHQKILYDKIPGKKEMHIIKGEGHTFKEPKQLAEIREIFKNWIDTL